LLDYKAIVTCTKCRNFEGYAEEMLPIVAFGNAKAPFLLLSLNPSFNEYKQTPSPLSSLPQGMLRDEMTDSDIEKALEEQEQYFKGNYFKAWFDTAEGFLNKLTSKKYGKLSFGIGNLKSNTTNIDICKCATTTIWGQLKKESKKRYISNCLPFFIEQIFDEHVQGIIINGKGVYCELKKLLKSKQIFKGKTTIEEIDVPINSMNKNRTKKCKVYRGVIERMDGRKIFIFGTSQRISHDHYGQFGNEHDRSRVAECIQDFINEMKI
jgi:hypothetical protein